ncbi:hypothetical protein TNCV_4494201 [Trichonephila clavipes]|nr:hypothetical protein TNCV_4494201 [Trichonephila clavipes]
MSRAPTEAAYEQEIEEGLGGEESIQSESSLSALSQAKNPNQPSTQMKNHSPASRIPSFDQSPSYHSAECKPPLSPCSASKTCHEMGFRTVLPSRCPKRSAYSTRMRLDQGTIGGLFSDRESYTKSAN